MKRLNAFPLLLIVIILSSCSVISTPYNSFFAWMNCYIAMPEKSEWTVSLTLFSDSNTVNSLENDICNIEFDGLSKQIPISRYAITYMSTIGKYSTYSFEVSFSSTDKGVYQTNTLVLTKKDNTKIACGIGDWYFDVGESPSETDLLDTYVSPAATSNKDYFPYSYIKKNDNVIIHSIKYGDNLSVSNQTGLEDENKLIINSSAPVTYIRTKIDIFDNGIKETFYGIGCYCGALDFDDSDLAESKEHCKVIGLGKI